MSSTEEVSNQAFFTADVGNSRIKIGRFDLLTDCTDSWGRDRSIVGRGLPLPKSTLQLGMLDAEDRAALAATIQDWLAEDATGEPGGAWIVASVNRSHADWLEESVQVEPGKFRRLSHQDMPMPIRIDAPDRVGLDRLAGAVAANELRERDRPAIVIDIGTAITVDYLSADGAFEGGAILPGIAMAARALESQTDALPRSPLSELVEPPLPVGKSTFAAIASGLLWGAVGAIRELVARISTDCDPPPQVFVTGGMSPAVVPLLRSDGSPVLHVPDLVLAGIAIVALRDRDSLFAASHAS